jgi:hypothetical protein
LLRLSTPDDETSTSVPEVWIYVTAPPKLPLVVRDPLKPARLPAGAFPDVGVVVSVPAVTLKVNEKVPTSPSGSLVVPVTL